MNRITASARWNRKAFPGLMILLLLLFGICQAKAQSEVQVLPPASEQHTSQSDSRFTASHREAAADVLHAMKIESAIMPSLNMIVDAQIKQNPSMGQYRDIIMAWSKKVLTWETVSARMIDILAETFTEPELREITAFYNTPTGQKTLNEMPEFMARASRVGAQLSREHSAELQKMISERKKDLDLEREAH